MAPAWQSLYRRYRPQRFAEVRGQDHVVRALRNAVREGRVAHAYLFSGPRGTGKTSTARILAKALNCESPADGEPDCTCASCVAIAEGSSLDVFELDAASNNRIENIRDLVDRVALGTPGRWKVYIVDEVHMLSAAASNALLKTLEEPPPHVVFVLATTDPQKVLPTIRSRTQHFELRLLAPDVLADLLSSVAADAGLDVAPEAIELVARRGNGSARDALSVLDQVAAAGGVDDEAGGVDDVVEALCDRDAGRALMAVAQRSEAGVEPRQLAYEVLERLRLVFLATMAPSLAVVADDERAHLDDQARRLGPPGFTRAMEVLGGPDCLVAMRDSPDPRVLLEVALVRLCRPDADTSPAAIVERLERLERRVGNKAAEPALAAAREAVSPASPAGRGEVDKGPGPAHTAKAALGAMRPKPRVEPPPDEPPSAEPSAGAPGELSDKETPAPTTGGEVPFPTRDELTLAWGDSVLGRLSGRARVLYAPGRFTAVDGETAVFALPNAVHRERCERSRAEVEEALAAHFGRPVGLRLTVADHVAPAESQVATPPEADDGFDPAHLRDAPASAVPSPLDQVMQAFEGAKVVEE